MDISSFNYPVVIPWLIFAACILLILTVSALFVCAFKTAKEWAIFPSFITIIGLTITLLCSFLIPIDIFSVSQVHDPTSYALPIRYLYYSVFLVFLVYASVLVPFAYFYYEESDETFIWKIIGAAKYTAFTVVCAVLLIALALILRIADQTFDDRDAWLRSLVDTENFGDRALSFLVAALVTIGLVPWLIYTTYGLAALPWSMLKRRKRGVPGIANSASAKDDEELVAMIEEQVSEKEEEKRNIRKVYEMSGKSVSAGDRKTLKQINARIRFLKEKVAEVKGLGQEENLCAVFFKRVSACFDSAVLYPIRLVLGLLMAVFILVLLVSVIISLVDRSMHSKCGWTCGFSIANVHYWNPIDFMLTFASRWFPLDYILFTCILWFVLLATVTGLATLGIRFLCIHLYKIRFRSTMPQGLLTASVLLMSTILIFSFWSVTSFAPQYATFGSQQVVLNETVVVTPGNGTGPAVTTFANVTVWCNYDAVLSSIGPASNSSSNQTVIHNNKHVIGRPCYASQVSTLMDRIALRAPYLSFVFYVANWAFVILFFLYTIIAMIKAPATCEREADYDNADDDNEDENSEVDTLVERRRGRRVSESSSRRSRRRNSEEDNL